MAIGSGASAHWRIWLVLAFALWLAVGCGGARSGGPPAGPAAEAPRASGPDSAAREAPATSRPPGAPPDQVKVGFLGLIVSNAGIFLAAERGYFEEQGLAIELVPFDSGSRMVPALATNEIQVGACITRSTAAFAAGSWRIRLAARPVRSARR
jgi:ABC-type nitrate/sulfonate/bicarbonate transport system substrate-binding protein